MLKSMRKNMKAVLWILIATFVLWGGSSAVLSRSKTAGYAGEVFGKKTGWKEYEQNYSAVYNQAKLIYGEKFPQISQYINLEQEAWMRIILLREAQKRRIKASNDETIAIICSMPIFQDSSGKFVPQIYGRVINYFLKVPPRDFEEQVKGSIIITRLKDAVIKDISISDEELRQTYKEKNEKINVDYALVSADDLKNQVKIDDEKIKSYYQAHKEAFKTPLRVNIEYIPFEYSQVKKFVTVSDEETNKYFQSHKNDYQKEIDDTKKNGSDKEQTIKNIKEQIKNALLDKKAVDKTGDAASDVSYELGQQKQPNLDMTAKKLGLPVKESGFFAINEPIPGIGQSYTVSQEAFKLETGQISLPIKSQTGRYIISLKDKKESYIPNLDEVREEIKNALITEEAKALAEKKANDLFIVIKQKVDAGMKFKTACAELKLDVKSTGQFTKHGDIPQIENSEKFADIASSQEAGKLAGAANIPQGAAIIFVTEKIAINEEAFTKEKDAFRKTALEEKQSKYFEKWFKELVEKADLRLSGEPRKKSDEASQQPAPASIPFDDF